MIEAEAADCRLFCKRIPELIRRIRYGVGATAVCTTGRLNNGAAFLMDCITPQPNGRATSSQERNHFIGKENQGCLR